MFCRRSSMRWIFGSLFFFWFFNSMGYNFLPFFGAMIAFYFIFKSDIHRLAGNRTSYAEGRQSGKSKNYVYDDMPVNPNMNYGNDDGLNRRIIRASDGEILVAVEDPQTGMLYLEDQA